MMDFPISGRVTAPNPAPMVEVNKAVASIAERPILPAPLSVEEARIAAETAREPREKTAIIRALLADPPASTAALSLATQIAAQASAAAIGYASARDSIGAMTNDVPNAEPGSEERFA
ncbi:hypothetical protein [Pseudorhodobacter sp.]|uniref:hypothetical protein n=1 Tax=Pseudorhodobacter sp. TaxID=1934400 RepID=UPI002647BEF3|nr:hypothetical protein [Pseudorhodobacter sp.]MDN5788128.1 hypothetical protein [Pseudorhodobacter sp.]